MSSTKEDRTDLSREDAEFVERLAANFAPAPMSPSRRVAFDEALWARLGRRDRRTILIPAFTTVAVAAASLEFGAPTRNIPARPLFRPVFEEEVKGIVKDAAKDIKKRIKKVL